MYGVSLHPVLIVYRNSSAPIYNVPSLSAGTTRHIYYLDGMGSAIFMDFMWIETTVVSFSL